MSSNATLDRFNRELDEADNGLTVTNTAVDSFKPAGVDGDESHAGHGGHTWRRNLVPCDYTGGMKCAQNGSTRDLGGRDNCSAGTDIHFDPIDMITVSLRLQAAIDRRDPRLDGVREINMWLGGANAVNRDQVLGWRQNYPPDAGHKSHIHIVWFRDVCENWDAVKGVLEIIVGTPSTVTLSEEDEMAGAVDEIVSRLGALEQRLAALNNEQNYGGALARQWRVEGSPVVYMGAAGIWEPLKNDDPNDPLGQPQLELAGVLRPDVAIVKQAQFDLVGRIYLAGGSHAAAAAVTA